MTSKHNLLLSTFLLCALTGVANGIKVGNFNYLFNETDKTATVTYAGADLPGYTTGESKNTVAKVEIPETVTYSEVEYTVTAIGNYAFCESESTTASHKVTSVTIPASVTSIGNHAFRGCSSLRTFSGGENVVTIGNSAFEYCSSYTGTFSFLRQPPQVNRPSIYAPS